MAQTVSTSSIKDIVYGIVITCLIFIISALVSSLIPFLGSFGMYMLPLPLVFYRLKLGRGNSAIILIAASCLLALIVGDISAELIFFVNLLLLGFVLGEVMELGLSVEKTVLYTCGAVLVSGLFSMLIYSNIIHTSIFAMALNYVEKSLKMGIEISRKIGTPEKDIQVMLGLFDSFQYIFVRIIPAMIIATSLIIVWANILLVTLLLNARGISCPNFGTLNTWKAPEILVWGCIASGVMLFLPSNFLLVIGLSCLIVFMTVYFFQGIAVVSFYFDKRQFSILLKFALYSLGILVFRQLIIFFFSAIGFFDIWMDFRKLEHKMNTQEN